MAEVTGIFIDGWFLDAPSLRAEIEDYLPAIYDFNVSSDCKWTGPDELRGELREAYKSIAINRTVRNWCYHSPVWQSLASPTYPTANLYIFPLGSIASLFAGIMLAEMERDLIELERDFGLIETVVIKPPTRVNEATLSNDRLLQMHAKQTWNWLEGRNETVALNLTSCDVEFKRAYRWVAALAQGVELFTWDNEIMNKNTRPIVIPSLEYLYTKRDFLEYYFDNREPENEDSKRFFIEGKTRLHRFLQTTESHNLKTVLQASLQWDRESEDKQSEKELAGQAEEQIDSKEADEEEQEPVKLGEEGDKVFADLRRAAIGNQDVGDDL